MMIPDKDPTYIEYNDFQKRQKYMQRWMKQYGRDGETHMLNQCA